MKQKILKLAKRMTKFSADDIVLSAEAPEQEVLEILEQLEKEGNIKNISNGYWVYTENNTETETPKEEAITVNIPAEVQEKLFGDYVSDFFNSETAKNMNPKSRGTMLGCFRKHVIPIFKDYKMQDITESEIDKFYDNLVNKQQVNHIYVKRLISWLHSILNWQYNDKPEFFVKPHQATSKTKEKTSAPKSKKTEIPPKENLQPKQIIQKEKSVSEVSLKKTEDTDLFLPTILVGAVGLQIPEVNALSWDDIDIVNHRIVINKIMINGNIIPTKYERAVSLSGRALDILRTEKFKAMKITSELKNEDLKASMEMTFRELYDNYLEKLFSKNIPVEFIAAHLGYLNTEDFLKESGYQNKNIQEYDILSEIL